MQDKYIKAVGNVREVEQPKEKLYMVVGEDGRPKMTSLSREGVRRDIIKVETLKVSSDRINIATFRINEFDDFNPDQLKESKLNQIKEAHQKMKGKKIGDDDFDLLHSGDIQLNQAGEMIQKWWNKNGKK